MDDKRCRISGEDVIELPSDDPWDSTPNGLVQASTLDMVKVMRGSVVSDTPTTRTLPPLIPASMRDSGKSIHDISGVSVQLWNEHDAAVLSSTMITTGEGNANPNGPMSPAMGATPSVICSTCHNLRKQCMGHMGTMPLSVPVVHPFLAPIVIAMCNTSCNKCGAFLLGEGVGLAADSGGFADNDPMYKEKKAKLPKKHRAARALLKKRRERREKVVSLATFKERLAEAADKKVSSIVCAYCDAMQPAHVYNNLAVRVKWDEPRYAKWRAARDMPAETVNERMARQQPLTSEQVLTQLQMIQVGTLRLLKFPLQDMTGLVMTQLPFMSMLSRPPVAFGRANHKRAVNLALGRFATSNTNVRVLQELLAGTTSDDPKVRAYCKEQTEKLMADQNQKMTEEFQRMDLIACATRLLGGKVPTQFEYKRRMGDSRQQRDTLPSMLGTKFGLVRRQLNGATSNTARFVFSLQTYKLPPTHCTIPWHVMRQLGSEQPVTSWNIERCREFVRNGSYVASFHDKAAPGAVACHCSADCDQIVMVNVRRGEVDGVPDAFCSGCGEVFCPAHGSVHVCAYVGNARCFNSAVCEYDECMWSIGGGSSQHSRHECKLCGYTYCVHHSSKAAHNCVCVVGCCEIRPKDASPIFLELVSLDRREKYAADLSVGDVVMRSLREGEYITLGRNPTLSMHSKQAMKIRGSHDDVFAVPAPFCVGTNADFDGDEGHAYGSQTLESAAEVTTLVANWRNMTDFGCHAAVQHQTLCTFTGLYLMTAPHADGSPPPMYNAADVQELVEMMEYNAGDNYDADIIGPPDGSGKKRLLNRLPAPIYTSTVSSDGSAPVHLWSGQQVFSMLLPNTLNVPPTDLGSGGNMHIVDGVLRPGSVLNKGAVASGPHSLVLRLVHRYGEMEAMRFNGCVGIMGDYMAQVLGCTLTLDDIFGTQDMVRRSRAIKEVIEVAVEKTSEAGKDAGIAEPEVEEALERITMSMLPAAVDILKQERQDTMSMMLTNRACTKGSAVNVAVGQVAKGAVISWNRRSGIFVNDKGRVFAAETLPQFPRGDMSIEARGFISRGLASAVGAFIGYTPHENLSSSRGGIDGVVATVNGVKDTGATQRELARGTEMHRALRVGRAIGLTRHTKAGFDAVVAFVVGENGLDVAHTIPVKLSSLRMSRVAFQDAVQGSWFSPSTKSLIVCLRETLLLSRHNTYPLPFEPHAMFDRFPAKDEDPTLDNATAEAFILEWCWQMLWRVTDWGMGDEGQRGVLPPDPHTIVDSPQFVLMPTALAFLFEFATCGKRLTASVMDDVLFFCGERMTAATIESGTLSGLAAAYSPIRHMTQDNLNKFHKPGVTKSKSSLQQLRQLLGVVQNLFGTFSIPVETKAAAISLRTKLNRVRGVDLQMDLMSGTTRQGTLRLEPCEKLAWDDARGMAPFAPCETMAVLRFDKQVCVRESVTMEELFEAVVMNLWYMLSLNDDELFPFVVAGTLVKDDIWTVMFAPHADSGGWTAHAAALKISSRTLTSWGDHAWQETLAARTAAQSVMDNILLRGHWCTGSALVSTMELHGTNDEGKLVVDTVPAVIVQGTRVGAMTELLAHVAMEPQADASRLMPTSVTEVYRTLGIEAARAVIVRELKALVSDGVAIMHLTVLADAMTYTGEVLKLLADGDVRKVGDSFVTKIIMQQPTRVAVQAALQRSYDNLMDPSAAAAFGKTPPFGTNDVSLAMYSDPNYLRRWEGGFHAQQHVDEALDLDLDDDALEGAAVAPLSPRRAVQVEELDMDDLQLDTEDDTPPPSPSRLPDVVVVAPAALDLDELLENGPRSTFLDLPGDLPDVTVRNVTMDKPEGLGEVARSILPQAAQSAPDVTSRGSVVVLHGEVESETDGANQTDVLQRLINRTEQFAAPVDASVQSLAQRYNINVGTVVADMMDVLAKRMTHNGVDATSTKPMKRVSNAARALNNAIVTHPPSPSVRPTMRMQGEFLANAARVMTLRFAKDPRVKDDAQFVNYFDQLRLKFDADTATTAAPPTSADAPVVPVGLDDAHAGPSLSSDLVGLLTSDAAGQRKRAKSRTAPRPLQPKRNADGKWDMPRMRDMRMPVGRPSRNMTCAIASANNYFHTKYEEALAEHDDAADVDVNSIAIEAHSRFVQPLLKDKEQSGKDTKTKFNTIHPSAD